MAKAPIEIRSLARSHTDKALKTLASVMNDENTPAAARVAAAQALLDRGWGKAVQYVEAEVTTTKVIRAPAIAENAGAWTKEHSPYVTEH